jgi:hypothetical protein
MKLPDWVFAFLEWEMIYTVIKKETNSKRLFEKSTCHLPCVTRLVDEVVVFFHFPAQSEQELWPENI